MKTNDPIESWLFDVRRAPLFAVYPGKDGKPMQIPVWRRDALIAADTGEVVGIVGNGYKLLTNQDALNLCQTFCRAAFPDTKDSDWIFSAAYGPRSRSRVSMDLYHRSIAIHFAGGASESFTPFARIVNSFDTSRAVRLEVGFIRAICSNGMIIHEATNQITAAHTVEDIRALKEKRPFDGMKSLTRQFEETLSDFRAVSVTPEEGLEITRRVMDWPNLPDKPAARTIADQAALDEELAKRNSHYFTELGENAYAVLNVLTDFASHPPENNSRMRRDRPTLQRIVGRWIRDFRDASKLPAFNLRTHIESLKPRANGPRK